MKENNLFVSLCFPMKNDSFHLDKNHYFIVPEGCYVSNGVVCLNYLEGISTPMTHKNIETETITRKYKDTLSGNVKEVKISLIKGLKFDSKLIDILLNRNLADIFTKAHLDIPNLILTLLLVGTLVVSIINLGVEFL